jgi:hypothetical protein
MSKIETNVVKPDLRLFENETEYLILEKNQENLLDNRIKDVEDFMKNNSGKGKSDNEKDELYKNAQELYKEYVNILRDAKYNFFLNRPQHKFLTDLILTKLEYDTNTVFFAIELTNMMGGMRNAKFNDDKDLISFSVNATEITYIYHLISKHKVKGLCKDAYMFSQVLTRIGGISKIFNYYDAFAKNLTSEIQDWVVTFEDGVVSEKFKEEVVEANVSKPKKKEKSA